MNRRAFLKSVAGMTAAGVVLPGDEVVRRFWRGWSPRAEAAPGLRKTTFNWDGSVFETGRFDASMPPMEKRPYAIVLDGVEDPILDIPACNLVRIGDGVAWWTGKHLVRNVTPFPHGLPEDEQDRSWGSRVKP
jgi:hypothetical protein